MLKCFHSVNERIQIKLGQLFGVIQLCCGCRSHHGNQNCFICSKWYLSEIPKYENCYTFQVPQNRDFSCVVSVAFWAFASTAFVPFKIRISQNKSSNHSQFLQPLANSMLYRIWKFQKNCRQSCVFSALKMSILFWAVLKDWARFFKNAYLLNLS